MRRKLLSSPIFCLLSLAFFSSPVFAQQTIRFGTHRATEQEDQVLRQHFSTYSMVTLEPQALSKMLRGKEYFPDLRLEAEGETYTFDLRARDIRAPHYKLRAHTGSGVVEMPRSPNKTYYGYTHKGQHDVRITADDNFFSALIELEHDQLFIEPAKHLIKGAPSNVFVISLGSHNLKKFTLDNCGVHEDPYLMHQEDHDAPADAYSSRACKTVQIALADDLLMYQAYGTVDDVEDHNMAVINNVETNYDTEFNDDLQFSVVEIYVATSAGTDPWTSSTDPGALLDDFTDWGPNGFDNTHDIASLWTNRNFNGDVIGLAWLNAVCSSIRYNVLEDFTSNASFLRVLQAHEMGHNFNANHDAAGSNTIMAPVVSNTNSWSTASINAINAKIASVACLGPCGIPLPPVANFDADPTEGCTPMTVNFNDLSTNNPTSWNWTFEGGTPSSSTLQNPVVIYNNPGTFNVTLTAANSQGSNTLVEADYIIVGEDPIADFEYMVDGLGVDFENFSENADTYLWNFGDGNTSTVENPFHEYEEDGIYIVTLTVTNSCGTDVFTEIIEIITPPTADFGSDITEGCEPMEVQFYNYSSSNAESFEWSFPGGSPPSSFAYEPSVVYEIPGTYSVSLTVINEAGEDTYTINNYITVLPMPVAEFNYTTNGLQVIFNSNGSVGDDFFWDFGDGDISTLPNPVHTYASSGTYQVFLTVTNDCGNETLQLNVNVTGAPEALFSANTQYGCAPLVVQFTNQSGGNPTSFNWVFQGGSPGTSTLPNPVVTYSTPGLYDVQLTVTNIAGSDVLLLQDYIEVEYPTESDFDFTVNGLLVDFSNQSSHATGYLWDFGDGQTSMQEDPAHVYSSDGVYTVMLISFGVCGNDTSTAQITLQTPPQAAFSFQQMSACTPAVVNFSNESSPNATSFAWSFPGGTPSSSTLENPSVTYTNPGTYDVSLIAYAPGGSDTMIWNDFVSIGTVPNAAFLLSTNDLEVSFENLSTDATSYEWDFGDGQISFDPNPTHTYDDFGSYTVWLIATNSCGDDTMEVVIVLSTVPNAFFSYNTHTGCAPFEVQFLDQSQNNPTSWLWTFEAGNPASSTLQNPVVLYTEPGSYSVTLQVSNSEGTDVLVLDGLIQVGGAPDASFSHSQNENVVSLEYPGLDYDSLRWSFGDGRTDNSLNPTVVYNTSGTYQISLIVYNACGSDTSSVWVTVNVTGMSEISADAVLWQIRPNPFHDVLTIYGEPLKDGEVNLSLHDVHGRVISQEVWSYQAGQATKEISAFALPEGVILVILRDERGRQVLMAVHQ